MKRENYERVQEIMRKINELEEDIIILEESQEEGESVRLNRPGFPVMLLDKERDYSKIKELIDYSMREKRNEIIELEKELDQL